MAGLIHKTAAEGEAALIRHGAPFYSRGGQIVMPVVEDERAAHGHMTKVARLRSVTRERMIDYLSRAARFEKYDGRSKKFVAVNPPSDVALTVLDRDGEWQFPPLIGVITTPTVRPDGTILATPGYDAATRLLLLVPPKMPAIPDRPTRADAEAALELLKGLLVEFPFPNEASRAVAFSGLITPVSRGAMTVAPAHGFTSPTPGSGKSFLVNLCNAIAAGQWCPMSSAGRSEEETEKRLVGLAMGGQAIICIDNLNGELGGDFLCQLIDQPVLTVRPLGGTPQRRLESCATFFCQWQ